MGFAVDTGVDVGAGARTGVSVGSGLDTGDWGAEAAGVAVGTGKVDGLAFDDADGGPGDGVGDTLGNPGETGLGTGPPQAVTSSPMAINRRVRARGTAAL